MFQVPCHAVCAGAVFCLFWSCCKNTMQPVMWQCDSVGVAHHIMAFCYVLGALDGAPDDAPTSSSSALAAGYL